jgi:hypothetical protein
MSSPFYEARKRQLARLGGAKPPTARAAIAIAKSQAYQDAADAPSTLRAYTADLANYEAWCERHGFEPMPATPEIVGAYLAAAGEGYALPTLRRRVAAIARACGVAGDPLDTKPLPSGRRSAGLHVSTAHRPAGRPHSPRPR